MEMAFILRLKSGGNSRLRAADWALSPVSDDAVAGFSGTEFIRMNFDKLKVKRIDPK